MLGLAVTFLVEGVKVTVVMAGSRHWCQDSGSALDWVSGDGEQQR